MINSSINKNIIFTGFFKNESKIIDIFELLLHFHRFYKMPLSNLSSIVDTYGCFIIDDLYAHQLIDLNDNSLNNVIHTYLTKLNCKMIDDRLILTIINNRYISNLTKYFIEYGYMSELSKIQLIAPSISAKWYTIDDDILQLKDNVTESIEYGINKLIIHIYSDLVTSFIYVIRYYIIQKLIYYKLYNQNIYSNNIIIDKTSNGYYIYYIC